MPRRPQPENLYAQRINIVLNYIRQNVTGDLSLNHLARVAGFSPFHFHRLFKSLTDETVADCVARLRLERAAILLKTSNISITQAALECGFDSASGFSRAFKKHFGLTARGWDRSSPLKNSKNGQVLDGFPRYTLENLSAFARQESFRVTVRTLPAQRLAYIRIHNSYGNFKRVIEAYQRLLAWYCGRGGELKRTTLYGMSQDDPEVTPLRLCRFDWCLSVPSHWRADGVVSVLDFPECQVATIRCRGDLLQEDKAIQFLFRYWLPRSRYQPANLPAMEIYRRQPGELGWETFDLDCAVPIVAL
jgi:AraC family transcriptional regulator